MLCVEAAAGLYGPAFLAVRWVARPGGFSGAAVFAGYPPGGAAPAFSLKAYPPGTVTPDRLARIHGWVRRAAHLPFVPRVIPASDGRSWAEAAGRLWELTEWKPGEADFRARPTDGRLSNACRAVAALHQTWRRPVLTLAPFPAVARRLALLRDWRVHDPAPAPADPELAAAVTRARAALPRWAARAERDLAPWADRPVPVHPCLCDVHHDHVLFAPGGDEITGVIDYGAMKPDHPAVDLARLLGDLVSDDPGRVAAGLAAYRAAGGAADVTDELVDLLDRTGTVCAVANWLLRLARPLAVPGDPAAVAERLHRLAGRLDRAGAG